MCCADSNSTGLARVLVVGDSVVWAGTEMRRELFGALQRAGAEGIPTRRIGEQLLRPVPDVTRLVDRLEKALLEAVTGDLDGSRG